MADPEFVDVEFLAPIPSGHTIYVADIRSSVDETLEARLILDMDSHALYCDPIVAAALQRDPRSVESPMGVLQQFRWEVVKERTATVVGTVMVSARSQTRVFLGPPGPTSPYR